MGASEVLVGLFTFFFKKAMWSNVHQEDFFGSCNDDNNKLILWICLQKHTFLMFFIWVYDRETRPGHCLLPETTERLSLRNSDLLMN